MAFYSEAKQGQCTLLRGKLYPMGRGRTGEAGCTSLGTRSMEQQGEKMMVSEHTGRSCWHAPLSWGVRRLCPPAGTAELVEEAVILANLHLCQYGMVCLWRLRSYSVGTEHSPAGQAGSTLAVLLQYNVLVLLYQ